MRRLLVLWLFLALGCGMSLAQGLSPKAGAVSEGLYSNLYFGLNYKLPADWEVSFVALNGECPQQCMLLDLRPSDPKSKGVITVSAEEMKAVAGPDQVMKIAAKDLEQVGAAKVMPPKEITIASRRAFRADYRSRLASGDLYYSVVVFPLKEYGVVFSFIADSHKELDNIVDQLPKAISFVGGS